MANPHGTPVWYELLTTDHDQARAFYEDVVGWRFGDKPDGDMDYRMIGVGADRPGDFVGGVMELTDAMRSGGAKPGWLFYVGVDDVDATAERVGAAGGAILMPPFDIADVGRAAFVADPQGAPFYIMRGNSDESSTAFVPQDVDGADGRCNWNELSTGDAAGAIAFYRAAFGWENRETMDLGPMGGYHFLDLGETRLGALMQAQQDGQAPHWTFYFRVPDLDAALARAQAAGAAVTMGPHDVPGGSRIFTGTDPQGAAFALVGPGTKQGEG